MLIVPVGLENSEVRRRPWVSIAVMGLMVAAFALLGPPSWGGGWGDRVEGEIRLLERFLLEHPDLKPAPDIESFLSDAVREEVRRRREQDAGGIASALPFVLQGREQELRTLEDGVREALREAPAWRYGFIPARPHLLDAITSIFLHGGWLHLIGNLFFFFATGPFLEDVYGRAAFSGLFLSSGAVAAYVQASQTPGSWFPLIGASGAIAGVMGAFLVRLGTSRIKLLFVPILVLPFIRVSFTMRAAIVLPLWFVEQAALASEAPAESGVAFWAHVGGFVFGMVAAGLIKVIRLEERWVDPGIQREISWSQDPAYLRASEARRSGDFEEAGREIAAVVRRRPEDIDALRLAFDVALDAGRKSEAISAAERLLPLYVGKGENQLARALVFDAMRRARQSMTPRFGVQAGTFLEREGEDREALSLYEELIALFPADEASLQALRRVVALRRREGDAGGVAAAMAEARRHPLFSREWEAAFRGIDARPARPR